LIRLPQRLVVNFLFVFFMMFAFPIELKGKIIISAAKSLLCDSVIFTLT